MGKRNSDSRIEIDGSRKEGGGQIVRTAAALSSVTGKSVKIENIRAGRSDPGLKAQHAKTLEALAKLCNAETSGIEIGSSEIVFNPGDVSGGKQTVNIGTAGSISLALQTLMIPAVHSEKPLDLKIKGGTMVKWSPTIYYIRDIILSFLHSVNYSAHLKVHDHGFYPKGGGLVEFLAEDSELHSLDLTERKELLEIKGIVTVEKRLKEKNVAERIQKYSRKKLFEEFGVPVDINVNYVESPSIGGGIDLTAIFGNTILGSNALIEKGVRSEEVAENAVEELKEEIESDACVDKYAADQLLPYMALSGEGKIKTSEITSHAKTNAWVIEKFLPVKFDISDDTISVRSKT